MMTDTTADKVESRRVYQAPQADIFETQDFYSIKMEVPGVTKENLNIVIDDDELKITAESSLDETDKELKYADFGAKNYSRIFRVGNDIDRNKIEAKLENGVLTLILHKSEEVKPKKISITQVN